MTVALPVSLTPEAVTSYILEVLDDSENTPYIGEPISQLQHSLQCANQAAEANPPVDEATQVAALLHDIGQFIPAKDLLSITGKHAETLGGVSAIESVGRAGHDILGGRFLLALGFPEKVSRLVASHVESKRYLCAVDPSYHDKLSDASKKSLIYQGGPMKGQELEQFGANPLCSEMCQLRVWDDEAKIEGLEVRNLESWRSAIERQLNGTAA